MIGCVIYVFALFIATEFIPDKLYEKYKYHALSLLVIDFAYLIYKTKYAKEEIVVLDNTEKGKKITFTDEKSATTSDSIKGGNTINGLSVSESDNHSIFSASSVTETEKNNSESITFGTDSDKKID